MSIFLVLASSLLGSVHCAAMCGGFVLVTTNSANRVLSQISYHFGRLLIYLLLGAVAGVIGTAVNKLGIRVGIARFATIMTGALLLFQGFLILWRYLKRSAQITRGPFSILEEKIFLLRKKLMPSQSKGILFPFVLGVFSSLLPCGWLYTYVTVAAATGDLFSGMAIMLFFWIGTVPMLATVGAISHLITAPLKRYSPLIVAVMMMLAGGFAITGHVGIGLERLRATTDLSCH